MQTMKIFENFWKIEDVFYEIFHQKFVILQAASRCSLILCPKTIKKSYYLLFDIIKQ